MYKVSGTVNFQEGAVPQGTVTFEDSNVGFAATANIESGGKYAVELIEGSHRVMHLPLFEEKMMADGMPTSVPVNPKSIPLKYQSTERSQLKLDVSQDSVFDINLR